MKIFNIAIIWMTIMVVVYTNLGPLPLFWVVVLNIIMQMGILSISTPGSAPIRAVPEPGDRGAFMSMNASLQQIAGGIAAWAAGIIVVQKSPEAPLEHYPTIGYVVGIVSIISLTLMFRINKYIRSNQA
ncbi:MAG: hypothetical protein ACO1NU_08825 [Arcticibacter sp.]